MPTAHITTDAAKIIASKLHIDTRKGTFEPAAWDVPGTSGFPIPLVCVSKELS
jgi:hypothetical protein